MSDTASENTWCRTLGIAVPRLDDVAHHPEANTYARLLVALLERGAPMTLAEVAVRFEQAGVAPRRRALVALQRCRPARAPVYRDGDRYHLDPRDAELDLWAFRLGLRPPRVQAPVPAEPRDELPGDDVPLTGTELDEGWNDAYLWGWPRYRLVLAVLDALGGGPRAPEEVVAAVASRAHSHGLDADSRKFLRRNSQIEVLADGRWAVPEDAGPVLAKTRAAVRERVAIKRRYRGPRATSEALTAARQAEETRREAHGDELASQSRALVVVFPLARPQAAALLDVTAHEVTTFVGEELSELRERLRGYDALGAVDVRAVLRVLGVDPGTRRLLELGPPQKTRRLNRQGRTLKITLKLLVQGTCGISRPFGDPKKLASYLAKGELTRLRRRLASDVKALYAFHEYGRLHGSVRLRWGFLDEQISAPWVHRDEPTLWYHLARAAQGQHTVLEIVVGSAPGWTDPWSRAQLATIRSGAFGPLRVLDLDGFDIHRADIQCARLRNCPETP